MGKSVESFRIALEGEINGRNGSGYVRRRSEATQNEKK
jgi:hypothetical protein